MWLNGKLTIILCFVHQALGSESECPRFGAVTPTYSEMRIGDDLNITCCVKTDNISCVHFIHDQTNTNVPKDQIQVNNGNSIVFMLRNAKEGRYVFTCYCDTKGVGKSRVFVGTTPKTITDFQCTVFDFQKMICQFTTPQNNVLTQFKLATEDLQNIECSRDDRNNIRTCEIAGSLYKTYQQFYNLVLSSTNALGNFSQTIKVDQYRRVVPKTPALHFGNITENGVTLTWSLSNYALYANHTNGLLYEIFLKANGFDAFPIDSGIQVYNEMSVAIFDLHSFIQYEVDVRIKANEASNTLWSERSKGSFITQPKRPEKSPKIDIGSFYIHPGGNCISLFWQQLQEYEQNGPDFNYTIIEVTENWLLKNSTITTDDTSALININWKNTSHYKFKIKSQNQKGLSLNTSILEITSRNPNISHDEQIHALTKVYRSENQTYTVLWLQPDNFDILSGYTLFWCIAKTGFKNQCMGSMMFTNLDKHALHYISEPHNATLNFALSENYNGNTYSSGMMWAMCARDAATNLNEVLVDEIEIATETSITIQWTTECWFLTILDGYKLTYCKVETNDSCSEVEEERFVSKNAKEYKIMNLKPSSIYKISIRMYSNTELGPIRDQPIFRTTKDLGMTTTKIIVIATLCVVFCIAAVALGHYARKKIYKMIELEIVLPRGLGSEENAPEKVKEVNEGKENMENESNLSENESFMPRSSRDPSLKANMYYRVPCVLLNEEKCENTFKKIESIDESEMLNSSFSKALPEVEDKSRLMSNGYIKPRQLNSGYVQPQQLCNGYVQPQQLMNASHGYNIMKDLQRSNLKTAQAKTDETIRNEMVKAKLLNENFSGYIKNNHVSDLYK